MSNNNIIIHIPKTGGTTLISNLLNIDWQPRPDFNYRHILYETKKSNCGDIFQRNNIEKYKKNNFIMFIRDPFERIISEYNFLKCRDEFFNLFDKKPTNLKEYILNKQSHNSLIKFLAGYRIFENIENKDLKNDLSNILFSIKNLNFIIGKTENYSSSLNIINNKLNININENISNKRVTLYKEPIDDYKNLKQIFINNNEYDYILYNKLNEIFELQVSELKIKKNYNFSGSKYSYMFKYTERFCILEAFNVNKEFIIDNKTKLSIIHNLAIKDLNEISCVNGKKYIINWLELFLKTFKMSFTINYDDPIKTLEEIAKVLKKNISV